MRSLILLAAVSLATPAYAQTVTEADLAKSRQEAADWQKKYETATPAEQERMRNELESKRRAATIEWEQRYKAASPEEKAKMDAQIAAAKDAMNKAMQK